MRFTTEIRFFSSVQIFGIYGSFLAARGEGTSAVDLPSATARQYPALQILDENFAEAAEIISLRLHEPLQAEAAERGVDQPSHVLRVEVRPDLAMLAGVVEILGEPPLRAGN